MRALALLLLMLPLCAAAMEPMSDAALSKVRGRDGMSFNLANFAMNGDATLRYTTPGNMGSLSIGNMAVSRSDNTEAPFADPYMIDVLASPAGRADIITLSRPLNTAGKELWQIAYDVAVEANGTTLGTSLVSKDVAHYGGGMQWTTPRDSDGLAWGYAVRTDIGSFSVQPNGKSASGEALVFAGIKIGAAAGDGTVSASPWRIADVSNQPGIFNARTGADGKSNLHFGIDWPDAGGPGAAVGAITVDNITFRSATTGDVNLGSSRIGGLQIQFLDVKFRQ